MRISRDEPPPAETAGSADAVLTVCTDGPILVRGPVDLVGADGRVIPRNRATIALCRCGLSRIKPLCDGTHKVAGFRSNDEGSRVG